MRSSAPRSSSLHIMPPFETSPIASFPLPMGGSPEFTRTRPAARPRRSAGDPMRALDIKLYRDLKRMWAQALAIALVVAGGAATLVAAVGSLRSLEETRTAYYERYQFADVFAPLKRAPKSLANRIAEIPGVAAVEPRIAKLALLDIPNFREPATGQFISLPAGGQPGLNRLYMRMGRMPEPGAPDEVVVSEGFAKAHAFTLGSHLSAVLNGRKRDLVIVGTALSPEFIYAVGPGDRMPDERRFAIVWMSEK